MANFSNFVDTSSNDVTESIVFSGFVSATPSEEIISTIAVTPNVVTPTAIIPDAIVKDGVISAGEYDYTTSFTDGSATIEVFWTIPDATTIHMALRGDVTGWIALGLGYTDRMLDSDIIIGSSSTSTNIVDNWGSGTTSHDPDTALGGTEDITNKITGSTASHVTLEFSRVLNTGDIYDNAIIPDGTMPVIWAYHSTSTDITKRHSGRAFASITWTSSIPSASPPGAPQTLATVVDGTVPKIDLTWGVPLFDGGSAITGYEVYRSTTQGSYGSPYATTGAATLSYSDTAVTKGTTYYYVVKAVNAGGSSPNSNEASGTPVSVPGAPTNLIVTRGDTQNGLTWSAPVDTGGSTITQYNVYRATTSGGPYGASIATVTGGATTYTDTLLTNGVTYYYVVSAT
ncbi:MAG: fibronectin type III domain-containing protein, partial [Candidatus Heimdallarchaeota archaeon]|nr:fibronectin type III domain-containing protein [Candidatus Heimdallarchaeota archaeon]